MASIPTGPFPTFPHPVLGRSPTPRASRGYRQPQEQASSLPRSHPPFEGPIRCGGSSESGCLQFGGSRQSAPLQGDAAYPEKP